MERHALEHLIETKIVERFADVELVDFELHGGKAPVLTVYIDRPGGVDLDLCAAVTQALDQLRDQYTLEVSSPGLDRPLRKARHFQSAVGERISVKTVTPLAQRKSFVGQLIAADSQAFTLQLDDGTSLTVPYEAVSRARLVYNFANNGGQRE